jgi:hypothetical protein
MIVLEYFRNDESVHEPSKAGGMLVAWDPTIDAVKTSAMRALIPVRKRVGWALRTMLGK